jgi:hypothetical protein
MKFYILPTESTCLCCIILTTNSDYFRHQHRRICLYSRNKYIYSAAQLESLNVIEVSFSVQRINQIIVVLIVSGVYENVAVSCQHMSASDKVT